MTSGDVVRGDEPDRLAPPRRGRFERVSLRGRLMTVGVLGVAAALLVGGLLLYVTLTSSLTRTSQAEALTSAKEVATLVDAGRLPDPVPVSGAQVVQVLDRSGRVSGGSLTADRLTPLVTEDERRRAVAGDQVVVPGHRSGLSGSLQVAAVEAGPSTNRVTVVAATPTADLEASGRTLRNLLLVLFPLLLLVLAAIAWRVIGAALRPVEALRHGAAQIDETSSDTERLPVPPTRDEISALARTLNDMLDRVASARRKQRSFVADAAHELRSPLASMRTQLEVAQRFGEGGALPGELLADVHRLSILVEDLLLLARADDDTSRPMSSEADLGVLLPQVVARYAGARISLRLNGFRDRGVGAAGVGGGGSLLVSASSDRLTRALTNLIDNGVRHAERAVTVTTQVMARSVELTISDDGHGIPAADRERVFDRFTRLDEARDRDSGGSGLGLPITRELLRRDGGSIRLEDAGPGLRAVVTLRRP